MHFVCVGILHWRKTSGFDFTRSGLASFDFECIVWNGLAFVYAIDRSLHLYYDCDPVESENEIELCGSLKYWSPGPFSL